MQTVAPSKCRFLSHAAARSTANSIDASWEYAFDGSLEAARSAFRKNVPADYKQVRDTDLESYYFKFDGNDSFYLTLAFSRINAGQTRVAVLLRGMPS